MMKRISLWSITALVLFSCEKEIKFKGNSAESLLVVNCITESNSSFRVQLGRSRFFLESTSADYSITSNAVITLTDLTNGQVYTSSTPGTDGIYDMGTPALVGHTFSIQVTHPDYETVSSGTYFPLGLTILSADTSSYTEESGSYMKANVTWNDPSGADFYVLKMALYNSTQGVDTYPELQVASLDPAMDPLSSSELGDENFTSQLFFTDGLFDGSQKTLEVRFPQIAFASDEHYKFILYRCSEATYKYLVSSEKARNADGDPFSEPVKVFTNIEKGYGIFGALTKTVFIQ